jgi:hypothetical protein
VKRCTTLSAPLSTQPASTYSWPVITTSQWRRAVLPSQESALRVVAASRSEESAYAFLILGSVEEAERSLGSIYEPDDDRPFIDEARARRAEVFARLRADGPEAATRLLRRWRDGTALALGVA